MLQSQAPLIVAQLALSLDGFSADPHAWPGAAPDVDAVAMGRATFDSSFHGTKWPWPGLDVHVLTSRPLPERELEAPVTAHADPRAMVEALRGHSRGALLLGGPRTIHALIELGAVDRLEVLLVPVLFGDGVPFALDDAPTHTLQLAATKTYDDDVVQLTYEFV